MTWSPSLAFELRKVYVRTLYAFELKEMRSMQVSVTRAHDLLLCIPIKVEIFERQFANARLTSCFSATPDNQGENIKKGLMDREWGALRAPRQ